MLRVSEQDHGTQDGRFQEGDLILDRPATRVTADWLNSIQSEICNVITSRGIELNPKDESQLLKAILDLYHYGVPPETYPIDNGVSRPTDLGKEAFDSNQFKVVYFNALCIRHTDQADLSFMTSHVATFMDFKKSWSLLTQFDPAIMKIQTQEKTEGQPPSLDFIPGPHLLSISATGKLQYQSSSLGGKNHRGSLILSHFKFHRIHS